jgi:AcrR family transcriptional regulator
MNSAKKNDYHHGSLKETLIQTTLSLLSNWKMEDISMSVLASQVGVSRTALYAHFDDKEDLLSEVAAYGYRELGTRLAESLDSEAGTPYKERAFALIYIKFALQHPELYRLMFGPRLARQSETLQQDSHRTFAKVQRVIKERLVSQGTNTPTNLGYCSIAAWAMVHGLVMLVLDSRIKPAVMNAESLETFVNEIIRHGPFS